MKIFQVLHGFAPELTGGTERTVEALARSMQSAGHDVTVVCGSLEVAPVGRIDEFEHAGLRVLRLHRDDLYFESWNKSYHPGLSRTVQDLFLDERPDIVHVHHWLRLTSDIARMARSANAGAVVTAHDYFTVLARVARRVGDDDVEPPEKVRWQSALEAEEEFAMHRRDFADELRAANVCCAPSAAHASGLKGLALRDVEFTVTPPPLLAVPKRLARAPEASVKRLVTWGSIYPDKGLEVVLDAMRAAGSDFRLDVYGEAHDPAYRAEIENFAAGLDVRMHGSFGLSDLESIEADCAVLPSLCHESYGLVMDEARALGLPVIASDLPAYREHCQEDACVFFTPGDAAELTMLLLDEARLRRVAAPESPELRTAEAAAADLIRIYESVDPDVPLRSESTLEQDRAAMLFRRAERRLYAALNAPELILPPDDFLAS